MYLNMILYVCIHTHSHSAYTNTHTHVCNCMLAVVSKSEKAKVIKLFHRLDTNDSGVVSLSLVTKLFHFRNNVLVKLVATQYARKQDAVGENTGGDSDREDVLDLEKFIELFDILSPKKDSSSKLKGMQCIYGCVV